VVKAFDLGTKLCQRHPGFLSEGVTASSLAPQIL